MEDPLSSRLAAVRGVAGAGGGGRRSSDYDDVFGGPPKYGAVPFAAGLVDDFAAGLVDDFAAGRVGDFAAGRVGDFAAGRVDDYAEIFGGLAGSCSIPVLDLPPARDGRGGAGLDYGEIFGGFGDAGGFAVPYEELLSGAKRAESSSSSSNGRLPREAGYGMATEVSGFPVEHQNGNHVASLEEDRLSSNSNHSNSGLKQFNLSFNKTSRGMTDDAISATTHVAQLHAVPGFTFVVDADAPSPTISRKTPNILNGGITEGKEGNRFTANPSGGSASSSGSDLQGDHQEFTSKSSASENGHANVKHHSRSSSYHSTSSGDVSSLDAIYLTVSDVNLRTKPLRVPPPSRPPPKLHHVHENPASKTYANSKIDLDEVSLSKPVAKSVPYLGGADPKSQKHQEAVEDNSSCCFDVEMNASSDAAASAAAMKEAMELAKARLKHAKASMERKRSSNRSFKRQGPPEDVTSMERKADEPVQEVKIVNKLQSQKSLAKEDKKTYDIALEERYKVVQTAKVAPDTEEKERYVSAKLDAQTMEGSFNKSSQVSHNVEDSGKWGKDEDLYELINNEKLSKVVREVAEQEATAKTTENAKKIHEAKENEKTDAGFAFQFERTENLIKDDGSSGIEENVTEVVSDNTAYKDVDIKEMPEAIPEGHVCEEDFYKVERSGIEENVTEVVSGNTAYKDVEIKEMPQAIPEGHVHGEDVYKESEKLGECQEVQEVHDIREESQKTFVCEIPSACGMSESKVDSSDFACEFEGIHDSVEEMSKSETDKESFQNEDAEKFSSMTDLSREPYESETWSNAANRTCLQDENETEIKVAARLCMRGGLDKMEAAQTTTYCDDFEKTSVREVGGHHAENNYISEGIRMAYEPEKSEKLDKTPEACVLLEIESKCKVTQEPDEPEKDLLELKAAQGAIGCGEQEQEMEEAEETCWKDSCGIKANEVELKPQPNNEKQETAEMLCKLEDSEKQPSSGINHGKRECGGIREVYVAPDILEKILKMNAAREVCQRAVKPVVEDAQQVPMVEKRGYTLAMAEDPTENYAVMSEKITDTEKLNPAKDASENSAVVSQKTTVTRKLNAVQAATENNDVVSEKSRSMQRLEKKENEERAEKQREQEKECARRLEEQKEREREREKDRIAVERAFAEARVRAEKIAMDRATAEARQRSRAREKAEKASIEAKEKSLAASREARLRAERAAVERATAEARERAVERALAEKAAADAKRMGRSYTTSRDRMRKDNATEEHFKSHNKDILHEVQSQNTGSSSSCQRNSASNSQGVGESALRCKARLERHQRTAERAAKALAEKNMRDLLAQREQAEKNRLAEYLDADVKRWSSGKEGNLRALLSTLQYILGPDSGWQPIPLTDVITAAAAKKAYRKATLFVHPDKLQQRGASIQQKYTCEKVFDLLKDAWNKFNSEER